jgi:hypothetical protein
VDFGWCGEEGVDRYLLKQQSQMQLASEREKGWRDYAENS